MIQIGNCRNLYLTLTKEERNGHDVISKKKRFDSFLSYKKSVSRLAVTQAICMIDEKVQMAREDDPKHPYEDYEIADEAFRTVIKIYKEDFFRGKYTKELKNQKLDERFIKRITHIFVRERYKIDGLIIGKLKKGWTINRLHPTVKAVLRTALCELIVDNQVPSKVIISQYVNIANAFLMDKDIAFVNAILHNIINDMGILERNSQPKEEYLPTNEEKKYLKDKQYHKFRKLTLKKIASEDRSNVEDKF